MRMIEKIKNRFNSSKAGMSILDAVTQNSPYTKFIYSQFCKKTDRMIAEKSYAIGLEVSSCCNARCIFCPHSTMKRKKQIMSMEIFEKALFRIKEEGLNPQQIALTGTGEPLLDPYLFERIKRIRKELPSAEISFPSNLGLATAQIREKLVNAGPDSMVISLNASNAQDYHEIMGLDFGKTLSNLEELIELRNKYKSKLKIFVRLAANPQNQAGIREFVKQWEKKVDRVIIAWVHSWANVIDIGKNEEEMKKKQRFPCKQLFGTIIILADGTYSLCCVDYEASIRGGNVMTDKILEAANNSIIGNIKNLQRQGKIDLIPMCSRCEFTERGLQWLE